MGYCSESQAGFRKGRATRDNIYILTELIDFCLERHKAQAVVTSKHVLRCGDSPSPEPPWGSGGKSRIPVGVGGRPWIPEDPRGDEPKALPALAAGAQGWGDR